jgi:integrase
LGCRVTAKGTRTFIAQWTDPATRQKVREPIGVWGNITIEQAREAARVRLGAVAKGINPKAERQRRRQEAERERAVMALTFDALIEEWATLHLSHRRPRYATETARTIRKGLPGLLNRPAGEITRAEAVNAIDKIVLAKPGAARNVLAYSRACFAWAERRGNVPGNPFTRLPVAAVARQRERVLSDDEVADLWAAAETLGYPFGPFYKLEILTLQRREMVAAMRWSEIDGDTWRIPGPRMKMGKPHDVHLSEPARAVLASLPRIDGCDFVFTTTGGNSISGFSKAKRHLDSAIAKVREAIGREPMAPWVPHDLRRTGVSKLAELGFDSIVADKLLAHKPAKLQGAAAIYQRYEFLRERAAALDAWAAHATGTATENVIPLRSASR